VSPGPPGTAEHEGERKKELLGGLLATRGRLLVVVLGEVWYMRGRMPRLRPRSFVWVFCVLGAALAGALATTGSGSHGAQEWAGQWTFMHTSGPSTGLKGGFALRHETDEFGAELLELIGGVACPEPTDYFAGAYTVPDTEDLPPPPDNVYVDTGKFRGCTVGDPKHLRGRYQSNFDDSVAGDFELELSESDDERWTGTFTADGSSEEYT
jgi:hypothetical protein